MRRIYLCCLSAAFMLLSVTATAQCWCSFLTSFTASQQTNKQVKISWSTNTESSTAKDFIVQRSFTGLTTDMVDIGYVSANPRALSHSYDFYDAYPCSTGVSTVCNINQGHGYKNRGWHSYCDRVHFRMQ